MSQPLLLVEGLTLSRNGRQVLGREALPTPAPYLGMIGSKRKCQIVLDHLRAENVDESLLARVHAPVGLNLGGRQPAEVALAILAEIEMVRHRGHAEPKGTLKMETTS